MDNLPDNLIVKGVFKDTYNLYLKYHGIPESYEKWENIKEDVDKVNQKYKRCKIATALCIALLNQLKYEDKE